MFLFCMFSFFLGGVAVDTAIVVGDKKKLGIYDFNFFEPQFIFVSPQVELLYKKCTVENRFKYFLFLFEMQTLKSDLPLHESI